MAARATLGSAVVLAALMVASVAAAAASPYVVHPVLHVYRANISAVQSHDDMAELYASSVKQDLRPWLSRRPPLADLQRHLHAYTPQDSRRVLLIRGGELYEAFSEEPWHCRLPCGRGLRQLWSALARWLRSPLLLQQGNSTRAGLPDAVFAVNTSPLGACRNETCGAPVLSLVKHAHDDEDILVPGAADMGLPLVYYPWDKKSDKAVFRGADLCPPNPRFGFCPRRYLVQLSSTASAAGKIDMALIAANFSQRATSSPGSSSSSSSSSSGSSGSGRSASTAHSGAGGDSATASPAGGLLSTSRMSDVEDQARYRYVISADGASTSGRFARLLRLNSIVLKQDSPWIEWYSRAMQVNMHYVPFWTTSPDDILEALTAYDAMPNLAQQIPRDAQAFAYRYFAETPRALYWQRALTQYKALYGEGMDTWIEEEVWPAVKAKLATRQEEEAAAAAAGQQKQQQTLDSAAKPSVS